MRQIQTSAFEVAQRYIGVEEVPGRDSNPLVLAMLRLDLKTAAGDEIPWCSAFANFVAFNLGLPRSRSLAARSWLKVGTLVALKDAEVGLDVVILKRGGGNQPGPEVTSGAPGHVGFFGGWDDRGSERISVLGGNQGDEVSLASFPTSLVLGIRRLA